LVIVGEDKNLRLAGQSSKGTGVQDAITVAFEGGAILVGLFFDGAFTRTLGAGGAGRKQ
jgi:hypothetical protein